MGARTQLQPDRRLMPHSGLETTQQRQHLCLHGPAGSSRKYKSSGFYAQYVAGLHAYVDKTISAIYFYRPNDFAYRHAFPPRKASVDLSQAHVDSPQLHYR